MNEIQPFTPLTRWEILAQIARPLMELHGLRAAGWVFEFSSDKTRYGLCNFSTRTIKLSDFLCTKVAPEAVRNTMLHEIAHALVGAKHGHDHVWRAKAIAIGCDGSRCNDHATAVDLTKSAPYIYKCDACGYTRPRYKREPRPGTTYSHTGCRGKITIIKNK